MSTISKPFYDGLRSGFSKLAKKLVGLTFLIFMGLSVYLYEFSETPLPGFMIPIIILVNAGLLFSGAGLIYKLSSGNKAKYYVVSSFAFLGALILARPYADIPQGEAGIFIPLVLLAVGSILGSALNTSLFITEEKIAPNSQ